MVLPLMNMPLMVPVTIMPLAGSGATAPKGDSNSWGRPRPWPVPNTFSLRCAKCTLSSVAMGLSGKMVGIGILSCARKTRQRQTAPSASACLSPTGTKAYLFEAAPGISFRLDTAKSPTIIGELPTPVGRARSTPVDDSPMTLRLKTNLFWEFCTPVPSESPCRQSCARVLSASYLSGVKLFNTRLLFPAITRPADSDRSHSQPPRGTRGSTSSAQAKGRCMPRERHVDRAAAAQRPLGSSPTGRWRTRRLRAARSHGSRAAPRESTGAPADASRFRRAPSRAV